MASNPFNALMDPQQLGASIQNAFQYGTQQRQQAETQRALGQYAQNQSPETAAGVTRHNPMMGMQLQDREAERAAAAAKAQEQAYAADLQRRAAGGDKAALAELAGIDISAWNTLNNAQKSAFEQNIDFIGNAALAVSQLPKANRPAAWDAYIEQGVRMGLGGELAQYVGQYSPDALNAVLASAGQTKTFLDMERPSYQVVPQGGDLVNTRDPEAVKEFQAGVRAGPHAGVVVNGFRFRSGNPNDRNNWEPEGGAGGNVSGGFQP